MHSYKYYRISALSVSYKLEVRFEWHALKHFEEKINKGNRRLGFANPKYRVIQEESALLWEMTVWVILSKKVHKNMGPILNGYGVMGIF